ncbi:hypothetical protein [Amycolatopsis sp. Hca4]|uniref:hypothetical protein n=1 Tax=Amycolatopsis sp. Hca4 TaxID=2742131 RepID=UPI0015929EB9|nr:hypothetical protein [Amycolatopsis sp. Hca4]QKV73967.1 hypothetical protein HUT10_09440 [Amycolatopsis sp. Hca4]
MLIVDAHHRLNIVDDVPSRPWSARVVAARVIGYTLLVGGTCFYAVIIVLSLVIWVAATAPEQPSAETAHWPVPLLVVGCFAYIPVGIAFLRYGRRGVLYLRRFGYTDGTAAVTEAALSIGTRWRIVTLDDKAVDAQEAPPHLVSQAMSVKHFSDGLEVWLERAGGFAQRRERLFTVTARSTFVLIVISLASGVFLPGLYPALATVTVIAVVVTAALGALLVLALVLPLLASLGFLPTVIASGLIKDAVDEANRSLLSEIGSADQLPKEVRRVKHLSRRVLAPRLTVLRVDSAIWRDAVRALMGICRVALIDVSCPRPAIAWEIEQLSRFPHVRCVFIGEHWRLAEINQRRIGADKVVDGVVRLVAERPVLAYQTGRDTERFVRALRSTLA